MTTVTVSGNTYNYRDILKQKGFKFDGDDKTWSYHGELPSRDIDYLRKLIGCMVNIDKSTSPAPINTEEWLRQIRAKHPEPVQHGNKRGAIYGDDETYFNHFCEKNPAAFFGFSSVAEMLKYIDDIPTSVINDHSRNDGWERDSNALRFTATRDMKHAFELAKDGWKEGTEKAAKIAEIISSENPNVKQRKFSVAGGSVNVGRLLAGNPANMKKREKLPGSRNITLFVDIGMLAVIDTEKAILRAACVAAICDLIEQHKYSCEIVAVQRSIDMSGYSGSAAYQFACTVKHAGERLNLDDVVFMLGHPSVTRRFGFALKASAPELRGIWRGMGASRAMFTDKYKPKKNDLYIEHLTPEMQNLITGNTLYEKARSMINMIVDEDFPIEVKI